MIDELKLALNPHVNAPGFKQAFNAYVEARIAQHHRALESELDGARISQIQGKILELRHFLQLSDVISDAQKARGA